MNVFELFGTIAINNRGANTAITDTTNKAERAASRISAAFKSIGEASVKIAKPIIAGATAIGTAWAATIESTRDYRTAMAQLDTAFLTNGHSAETAKKTYKALQAVLGDTDRAVEAATSLAQMVKNEEDLSKWTEICTGVFAEYQGKLPIEGLTEAANETAKVGVVTGNLADALNWAGISEDDFNLKLKACTSEHERQELIMNTLYWTYRDASEQYKKTGADVMKANAANEKLTHAISELGRIGEPIMTGLKTWIANMVAVAVPHLENFISKFGEINNVWTDVVWPLTQSAFKLAFDIELPDPQTTVDMISEWWNGKGSSTYDRVKSVLTWTLGTFVAPALDKVDEWWTSEGGGLDKILGFMGWTLGELILPGIGDIVTTAGKTVAGWAQEFIQGVIDLLDWTLGELNLPTVSSVIDKIQTWWSGVTSKLKLTFGTTFEVNPNVKGADPGNWENPYVSPGEYDNGYTGGYDTGSETIPQLAKGLNFVPRDNFRADLHYGEAVLTRTQADVWRSSGAGSMVDFAGIKESLDKLYSVMVTVANNTGAGHTIMLDSGILAGQLAPAIDARLGTITARKGRWS